MSHVMRCKFQLNSVEKVAINHKQVPHPDGGQPRWLPDRIGVKVKFGAVYEGNQDRQRQSENALFGEATPHGSFEATIHNVEVARLLEALYGREFYLDFTLVPDASGSA